MADSENETEQSEKAGKKRRRSEDVRLTVEILEKEKRYRNLKVLGRGTYGDVYMMYDPERESNVAVKIVTSENIAEAELAMWPKLHHPNIVPLLELMTLRPVNVAIFIMPVQKKTLHDMMYEKRFLNRNDCLDYLKIWLYEILCALEYLDSRYLCHLDIKVDNVLISKEYTAMICDFSFLNSTIKPLERYDLGLPYIYRPPEACQSIGSDIVVDGRAYDMWGFGIMVLEIFTHFVLAANIPDCSNWVKEVYPTLFNILQEREFCKLMIQTFHSYDMSLTQVKLALNFIHSFLMFDANERATPIEALQHQFLNRGILLAEVTDAIWIHKIQAKPADLLDDKKRKTKLSVPVERIVTSDKILKKTDGSDPSTDDEYLTVSESDDDTKSSSSVDKSVNNLSKIDHSSKTNTSKVKGKQNKITKNMIKEQTKNENSNSNSDSDLSQMDVAEDDDVPVREKVEKIKPCQLQPGSSLKCIKQVEKPYTYHLSRQMESIEQFIRDSKYFPQLYAIDVPKKLKRQYAETQNKPKVNRDSFIAKRTHIKPRLDKYHYDERQLRYMPCSDYLLKNLHERKNLKLSECARNRFYRKVARNAQSYKNRTMDAQSEYKGSSESSLSTTDSRLVTKNSILSQNESECSGKTEICTPGKEETSHGNDVIDETMEINNSDTKTEIDTECNSRKFETGDSFQADFGEFVNVEDVNVPTTSQKGLAPATTKDEKTDNENDASQFMTSVTQTLGQLNQINDILQKVMICENCNSKRKHQFEEVSNKASLTEISPGPSNAKNQENIKQMKNTNQPTNYNTTLDKTDIEDIEVLENMKNKKCMNSDEFSKDTNVPLDITGGQNVNLMINCPITKKEILSLEAACDVKEENKSKNHVYKSAKRRKGLMKWMRSRYLQIERAVKCWPYKIMK